MVLLRQDERPRGDGRAGQGGLQAPQAGRRAGQEPVSRTQAPRLLCRVRARRRRRRRRHQVRKEDQNRRQRRGGDRRVAAHLCVYEF